jgi:hypothetical protein
MNDTLAAFIDAHFKLPVTDEEDKRCTPEDAIARHVEKEMTLYVPCGAALLNPLIRTGFLLGCNFETPLRLIE